MGEGFLVLGVHPSGGKGFVAVAFPLCGQNETVSSTCTVRAYRDIFGKVVLEFIVSVSRLTLLYVPYGRVQGGPVEMILPDQAVAVIDQ